MAILLIGNRRTFFPPFVNERFDPNNKVTRTGFWSCTWSALHVGLGVARWGQIPATPQELQDLVKVSGDGNKRDGSTTEHMMVAARVRYGIALRQENVGVAEAKRRLASGQALVAGLFYGKTPQHDGLPDHYRRWSPGFFGNHRATLIGYDAARDRTRIFDPLANRDTSWTGEWIKWEDWEPAWWKEEQVWIAEGEGIVTTINVVAEFAPAREFKMKSTGKLGGFRADRPGQRLRVDPFAAGTALGKFDAVVSIKQAPDSKLQPNGTFIRVTSGQFKGLFVRQSAVTANFTVRPAPVDPAVRKRIELNARREEFERVTAAARVVFPDPPAVRARRTPPTLETLQAEIERLKGARIDFPPDPLGVDEDPFADVAPPRGRQPVRNTEVPDAVSPDDAGDPDPPDPAEEPALVPDD